MTKTTPQLSFAKAQDNSILPTSEYWNFYILRFMDKVKQLIPFEETTNEVRRRKLFSYLGADEIETLSQ